MPLALFRRGPTWYVRGVVVGALGKIACYETTGTSDKAQAEAYREARQAELFKAANYGARAAVSFRACAMSYLEHSPRAPGTVANIDRLIAHFGDRELAAVDQAACDEAIRAVLGPGAAPATRVRTVITPLTAVLNHGHDRGWCDVPRFKRPKLPRGRVRWLRPAEARALLGHAAPHLRPMLLFLLGCGARLGEALALDWQDVRLAEARAILRDTKSGRDRIAALPPAVVASLASLPLRDGRVFRRDDGEPYAERAQGGGQIKTGFAAACRRAGIADLSPHDLRHTWASWFYAATKDLLLLQDEGGWASTAMVQRYAHLMPADMAPEIATVWGASHPRIGALPVRAAGAAPTAARA